MLESKIEKAFQQYCEDRNVMCLKVTAVSNTGLPDRLIIGSKFLFWVEFKAEGKYPTRLQRYMHSRLRDRGGDVLCFNTAGEAEKVLDTYLSGRVPYSKLTDRGITVLDGYGL